MSEFRIDIVNTADGLIMKVTADCRSVPDVDRLVAALKAARRTLGSPSGRSGGSLGGLRRAAALTPARRSEIASEAANKRWGNVKK